MKPNAIVSRQEWLEHRIELLNKEKQLTRQRDQLAAERRQLPWVQVGTNYTFDTPTGAVDLLTLFANKRQLFVYHFMFDKDWDAGCKICSFWADHYQATIQHLNQRDTQLVTISTASIEKIEKFRQRMGWQFNWVSAANSDFGRDFWVSYTDEEARDGQALYNFNHYLEQGGESPGISVFIRDDDGNIYHTYSAHARGLEPLNPTYGILDLLPHGRAESDGFPMSWVRLHDEYD